MATLNKNIKRILVIKLRHIGDVLLSIPLFRALRENFPHAHITAIVNSGTEEVLRGNPLIDEILSFDREIKRFPVVKRFFKEMEFLRDIRKGKYDLTIDLTGGDRAAIISFVSGAGYKIGWKSKEGLIFKRYLYTHLSKPDTRRHMVLQNLDVVRQFGIDTDDIAVDFYIPDDARTFAKKILEENKIIPSSPPHSNGNVGVKVIHIHPTSRWLFKCWKDEYMADVISWLLDKGINVIVTSSPDKREMEKAKGILSLVYEIHPPSYPPLTKGGYGGVIDLCGKTTIKQLAAISEISDLFIGVDSAPMHIAAAVGTPVVALFGPSGAFHWGPWDNESFKFQVPSSKLKNPYTKRNGIQIFGMHTVIQRDWNCIPCGKDGCNGSKISKCLEDIRTEEIKDVLTEKLKKIE